MKYSISWGVRYREVRMAKKNPWDHHPDFTVDRLKVISAVLTHVHNDALTDYDPDKGDTPWGLGVKCFDRSHTIFLRMARRLSWLRILNDSKHLVFQIGAIPARFCRADEDGRPNSNMLTR